MVEDIHHFSELLKNFHCDDKIGNMIDNYEDFVYENFENYESQEYFINEDDDCIILQIYPIILDITFDLKNVAKKPKKKKAKKKNLPNMNEDDD